MLWANKHTVLKYPLSSLMDKGSDDAAIGVRREVVEMPAGARIVLVDRQHGVPTLWAEVSLDHDMERRLFVLYGTGQKIDDDDVWVGSFQDPPYVWHVYESNP